MENFALNNYFLGAIPELDIAARKPYGGKADGLPELANKLAGQNGSTTGYNYAVKEFTDHRHDKGYDIRYADGREVMTMAEIEKGKSPLFSQWPNPQAQTENTVRSQFVAEEGGVKYSTPDNLSKGASEIADTNIKFAEHNAGWFADQKLDKGEVGTYYKRDDFTIFGYNHYGTQTRDTMYPSSVGASISAFDKDGDNKLSKDEISGAILIADTNKDGLVSQEEALSLNSEILKRMKK